MSYRVPKQRTRVEIKVSNSRFIATVAPAFSVQDARAFIRAIRAEMPDATHHVYAFKIGHGASVSEGLSDDGEPAGTAGPPAMAVLRGSDVGDVVLVLTRYFGGTKLGTGGLVAAYTEAAQAAFAELETEEKVVRVTCTLQVPYAALDAVRRTLDRFRCVIESEDFAGDVTLRVRVPVEEVTGVRGALRNLSGGRTDLTEVDH